MTGYRYLATLLLSATLLPVMAQGKETFEEYKKRRQQEFADYKAKRQKEFDEYRRQRNKEFAERMLNKWPQHDPQPPIEKPKEDEVPPVVMPKEDRDKPIETKPVPIEEVVAPPPAPKPQPEPIAPIDEKPQPVVQYVSFNFYGTECKVRFNDNQRFKLSGCDNKAVVATWNQISSNEAYDNMLYDCLELRKQLRLSDWAYLNMLAAFSEACMGKGSNEARLLMGFIYCQSGYRMRFGSANGRLYLLYSSEHMIYGGAVYYNIGSEKFYVFNERPARIDICEESFPKERSLSLWITSAQRFAYDSSEKRVLQSGVDPEMRVETTVNKNLIDFYNSYPTSIVSNNFMTRWAMYANGEMDEHVQKTLYPALREKLRGNNILEAANRLLNWVQTAFVYEYDDKVWGEDRAFFAEETLYYPYCDCEDRAIFFSKLIRDLLGLDVILVYYPGHLATAVCFNSEVPGDYIMLNGRRFTVCDPTITGAGAPVGRTMPGMDNRTAKVILLKN